MTTAAAAFPPPTICRSTRGISSVVPTAKGRLAASRLGSWGDAEQLPGSRWLSAQGQQVRITALSCASAGNCAAGGLAGSEAFVANEKDGTWGSPAKVPGLDRLNLRYDAAITSVSCAAPGDCSAGGYYSASPGYATGSPMGPDFGQAFVVDEHNGVWGDAEAVPGLVRLNVGGYADITSVSCAAPGDCSAGGFYGSARTRDAMGAGPTEAFLVDEVDGTWDEAEEVLHMGALNRGGRAEVTSLSCGAIGYCSAGGHFNDGERQRGFVISEDQGAWQGAQLVPGLARLNPGGPATVSSVSCSAERYCAAGGYFVAGSGRALGFVVTEVKGHWGDAQPVKESASLTGQRYTFITLVSCPSSGNCGAAGYYGAKTMRALVVDERNGVWGAAQEIPHWPWLDAGGYVSIYALSCASAGNCAAGGLYVDGTAARKQEAFVVDETDGTWNRAEEVPNTARLNSFGLGATTSVSCAPNGGCTAAGYYADSSDQLHAFVTAYKSHFASKLVRNRRDDPKLLALMSKIRSDPARAKGRPRGTKGGGA
jgi:hypothetical protein